MNTIVNERCYLCNYLYSIVLGDVDGYPKSCQSDEDDDSEIRCSSSDNGKMEHVEKNMAYMNNIIEERYTEKAMMRVHSHVVSCLTLHENKLYSGGYDKTIRIWNTETHEEIAILRGHTNGVIYLNPTLRENKLYTGSYDNTIRIWNI